MFASSPELDCPLPRPVRLTANGFFECAMYVALIAACVWLPVRDRHRNAVARRLLTADRETEAVVVKRPWGSGHVNYRFSANGWEYEGRAKTGLQRWKGRGTEERISVRYLSSDPAQNYPRADPPRLAHLWASFVVCLPVIACCVMLLRYVRREWQLVANGRPAPAVVTRVEKRRWFRLPGPLFSIHYEFPLAQGGTYQCVFGVDRDPPPVGSPLCILYDPENPSRHVGYPSYWVKLSAAAGRGR